MAEIFDTLLLLALPASGKSEVRTYLTAKDPAAFHMGPTVQLDDYPYVHLQLLVDEAFQELDLPRPFHHPDPKGQRNGPFKDPRELAGLVELLSDDYRTLRDGDPEIPDDPVGHMLERFDRASEKAGAKAKFRDLPDEHMSQLKDMLAGACQEHYEKMAEELSQGLDGKTLVIEFARGGPKGDMPFPEGYGYAGALPHLDPGLLESACILYIWVTPEDSRRKNVERVAPDGGHGSILFHGTPESVMDQEYGACDLRYLLETSDRPNTVRVERDGETHYLPTAIFDNREDLTTFLRKPQAEWTEAEIEAIHGQLKTACDRLWETYTQ